MDLFKTEDKEVYKFNLKVMIFCERVEEA